MLRLSHSKMKTFNRCPQKYRYRYIDKYLPEGYVKPENMVWGSFMHHLLEQYLKLIKQGCDTPIQLTYYALETVDDYCDQNPEVDEYGIREEVIAIFRNYVLEFWKEDVNNWEVVSTEMKFEVPILDPEGEETGMYLMGYIDALVKDKRSGELYIMEHKTTAYSIEKRTENLVLDDQVSLYCLALHNLGYDVKGVIYDVIRKKIPSVPKLLKNGKLSTAQIDTTPEVYRMIVQQHGLNVNDYEDKLQELATQGKPFFKRVLTDRTQEELHIAYLDLYHRSMMISVMSDNNAWYRLPCNDCNNDCMYIDKCKEDFTTMRIDPETGEVI